MTGTHRFKTGWSCWSKSRFESVRRAIALMAMGVTISGGGSLLATDGTWVSTVNNYYTTTNAWAGGTLASGAGSSLTIVGSAAGQVIINTNVTLGAILFDVTSSNKLTIMSLRDSVSYPNPICLTLDSGSPDEPAKVWHQESYNKDGTPRQVLDFPIVLNSDLFFRSSFTNKWEDNDGPAFSVHCDISEGVPGRSLIISNDHPNSQMTLFGSNSFSGDVRVQQGVLRIADLYRASGVFSQLGVGSNVYVKGGTATLDLNGLSVGPEKTLHLGGAGGFGMGALANSYNVPGHTSVWYGAVSLASDATLGQGVGGGNFWMVGAGGPVEIAGPISDSGNKYGLVKTSANLLVLSGNNTYSGGTTISQGYVVATNVANLGTGPLIFNNGIFGFGAPFDLSAVTLSNINSRVMILDTCGFNVTLANPVTSLVGNGLTKIGAGTLTLSGANSYKNATTVNRGMLVLDYASQPNSKVYSTSAMVLGGGTLAISGGSGYTQAVGSLTINTGASAITNLNPMGGTVMNFSSTLTRSTGGTVSFGTAGAPMTLSPGLNNGLYGGFATFGDSTWATKNATNYFFQFITGYTDYSSTWAASSNVDVTVSNIGAVGENAQANTLRFNNSDGAGAPVTLTLIGTNSLTGGGILVTPAMGANPVIIQGGTLTSKNVNWNDLIIIQNNTNAPLVITSSLTNNGTTSIALTKSGPGALVISNSASLFNGNVYLNGGALEIYNGSDLGDTNTSKTVVLNGGAVLRLFGTFDLGSTGAVCNVNVGSSAAGADDTVIDIPNATDTVTLTGTLTCYGRLIKRGNGCLRLRKSATGSQLAPDPFCNIVVESGTLDIGTLKLFDSNRRGVVVVKNGATLKGPQFLNLRNNGRADYQDYAVLQTEGDGGTIDLNGSSVNMSAGTLPLVAPTILPNDNMEGGGLIVLTNSVGTSARFFPGQGVHSRFNGVFEVPGNFLATGEAAAFSLPYGELRLGASAIANFSYLSTLCQFGALTGSGYFGGWGDHNRPPFCIGDNRNVTFEFSGFLIAYNTDAVGSSLNTPTTGCRFIKTGSSSWRISGTTNDIRQAFTVRTGNVLTGADSAGVTVGALGKGPIYMGDNETASGDSLGLLTDGAYMIGNKVEFKTSVSGSTITLGGNQTVGASFFTNALDLTRNVCLHSAGGDVTFSGAINGLGGITKTGVGTVYLTGTVSNTGPTVVQAGQLVLPGGSTLMNALTVVAGSAGGGMLAVNGNLTLGDGASLAVSVSGALVRGQTYTLVTWTGSRSGKFLSVNGLPDGWHVGYLSGSMVLYYASPGTLIKLL